MIKYLVYPGNIRSTSDGDTHYISATELMKLYGVSPAECKVVHSDEDERGYDLSKMIKLHPRMDGDYKLPAEKLKDISNDTIFYGHVSALTNAALGHNASVIQLASEVIAAGPGFKQSTRKRIREEFDRLHKNYQKEYQRIIDSLEKELES